MKSVLEFIKKFAVLRKIEILPAKVTYYITPSTLLLKNLPLTSKEAYIAYMSTSCTLVRTVRVISGQCKFQNCRANTRRQVNPLDRLPPPM